MTAVIIGGGPTGVEMAGSFAEIARHVLKADFRRIDTSTARIYLVEAAPRLLTMYDEEAVGVYQERNCSPFGVMVRTGTMVEGNRKREGGSRGRSD